MHTSSGQSSLFVQFPSNLPVALELLNKGTSSSNLEMEQKQGDDVRLGELKDLLGFPRSMEGILQPKSTTWLYQLNGEKNGTGSSSSNCH